MAFHNILAKTDQALVDYLISEGAGTSDDVLPAKNAGTTPKPPYTIVVAESFSEAQEYSAAFIVKASVEVHTNAAPTRDESTDTMAADSNERTQLTGDALYKHTAGASDGYGLGEEITAATNVANFTCISARVTAGEAARDGQNGEWVDIFTLELLCTPSDIE